MNHSTPSGDEGEGELETMLDDTEYDSQLGMDMARDAMRVTKGELSEADFHEKYHEDVMEEFGEDERPTKEAYEAAQEEAKGTFSEWSISSTATARKPVVRP